MLMNVIVEMIVMKNSRKTCSSSFIHVSNCIDLIFNTCILFKGMMTNACRYEKTSMEIFDNWTK